MNLWPLVISTLFCISIYGEPEHSAVTYTLNGGRLGDNLVSFCHAAWLAHIHNLKLVQIPFEMSNRFIFSSVCEQLSPNLTARYLHQVKIPLQDNIMEHVHFDELNALYIAPYFPEFVEEYLDGSPYAMSISRPCFIADWRNQEFIAQLRYLLSPMQPIATPVLPVDRVCVALHLRRGGGYDAPCVEGTDRFQENGSDRRFPYKCPPFSFFTEQLITLHDELGRPPFYVFVFTDESVPQPLVERIARYTTDRNIVFDYRRSGNAHNKNVVEDFVFMQKFTYIIRPQSNYSFMAAKLGSVLIDIEPCAHVWEGRWLTITKVRVTYAGGREVIRECAPQQYR